MDPTPLHPPPGRSLKAMWATIGALAVAVAALGGVLLHQLARNADSAPASPVAAAPPMLAPAPDDGKPGLVPAAPPPPVVAQAPAPVRAPDVLPPPAAPAAAAPAPRPVPVCATCGHVESVHPVQRQVPATGVGAVAGGVLGGVLGNQIGHGNGRTAATVIGAVGGGFAGNEVEKRYHTATVYEVGVRMQDGSLRTVETATAPPVGKAVTLKGKLLQPADGHK
ncbi:glycine zipper 2TM domain-containing protein [Variovorax ginsengisoli]|uniref:Glycine zipper 2TM domain-containing protein n=1 Tax=Variovorax ginsengisoli TaxID=363844 RepID=A0ABT8S7C6_9BURK|nr:glycine zipper 2TM domain-containing protein [Variovorax ginsengisoli]MDN8614717.1 glycine zipper 2TM domain-containing protein [Variovorax ginsengisoli]MDO1533887.1 glycine zipper 2TM domain-containing protein [Variovorax ginsengisoli]